MADKKFITRNGLHTANVDFVFANTTYTHKITTYRSDSNTLSISSNTERLVSFVDTNVGDIFTVNDVSGISSIKVKRDGDIILDELSSGNVGIRTSTPSYTLDVTGDINFTGSLYDNGVVFSGGGGLSASDHLIPTSNAVYSLGNTEFNWANVHFSGLLEANGSFGTSGQVLTSGGVGANAYWSTVTGGGGDLSASDHLIPTSNAVYSLGNTEFNWANVHFSGLLEANGSFGTSGQVLTSGGPGANAYWSTVIGGGGSGAGGIWEYVQTIDLGTAMTHTFNLEPGVEAYKFITIDFATPTSGSTYNHLIAHCDSDTTAGYYAAGRVYTTTSGSRGTVNLDAASRGLSVGGFGNGNDGRHSSAECIFYNSSDRWVRTHVHSLDVAQSAGTLTENVIISAYSNNGATGPVSTLTFTTQYENNTTISNHQPEGNLHIYKLNTSAGSGGGGGDLSASDHLIPTSNAVYSLGNTEFNWANVHFSGLLQANGSFGTSGQVLTSGGTGANVFWSTVTGGGGSSTFDGLTDVTITTPTNGQVLKYNGSIWVNGSEPSLANTNAWLANTNSWVTTVETNQQTYLANTNAWLANTNAWIESLLSGGSGGENPRVTIMECQSTSITLTTASTEESIGSIFNTANTNSFSDWDTVNDRYQPQVAGWYNVTVWSRVVPVTNEEFRVISLYKNGVDLISYQSENRNNNTSGSYIQVSGLVYLNGTTDYVEPFGYRGGANILYGNAGGYGGAFSGHLVTGVGGATVAVANTAYPAYRVTSGASDVNNVDITTSTAVSDFSTVDYDLNSNFNTSTQTFTAPYKGLYEFKVHTTFNNIGVTTGLIQAIYHINGNAERNSISYAIKMRVNSSTTNINNVLSGAITMQLNQNDTAQLKFETNAPDTTITINADSYHEGRLIQRFE